MKYANHRLLRLSAVTASVMCVAIVASCSEPSSSPVDVKPQNIGVIGSQPTTVPTANSPYEGTPATINAHAKDADKDVLTFGWDFDGDNNPDSTTASGIIQYTWQTDGIHHVVVVVSDGHNPGVSAGVDVTVKNKPPVLVLFDYGSRAANDLDAAFGWSDVAGDGPFSVHLLWGDGTAPFDTIMADTILGSPHHHYTKSGPFTLSLTVTDKDGGVLKKTFAGIGPSDPKPVADAGGPYAGTEGGIIPFSAAGSSDPGGQPLTYLWQFGDGITSKVSDPTHAYGHLGTYHGSLIVTDPAGQSDTATFDVVITNTPPSATMKVTSKINEGSSIVITMGRAKDPGGLAEMSYAYDCGGGGFSVMIPDTTFTCPPSLDNDSVTVRAKISDGVDETVYSADVVVLNVKPILQVVIPGPPLGPTDTLRISAGSVVPLFINFGDPGIHDGPFTLDIGVGNAHQVFVTPPFLPPPGTPGSLGGPPFVRPAALPLKPGVLKIVVKLSDKDGGTTSVTYVIIVTPIST